MTPFSLHRCPLCSAGPAGEYARDRFRTYLQCISCGLVFVPSEQHLTPEAEKQRYGLHANTPDDAEYKAYLSVVADIASGYATDGTSMLDFGCGAHAVLETILRSRNVHCDSYDPLYGIGLEYLNRRYDVVVACEVVEHLRDLRHELERVKGMLNPAGIVLLRTQLIPDDQPFTGWWYAQDPTHINFFNDSSLKKAAEILGGRLTRGGLGDVFVMGPCRG